MLESEGKTDLVDRLIVLIDDDPQSRALLRHGWRLAQGMGAELLIAYFHSDRTPSKSASSAGPWNWQKT